MCYGRLMPDAIPVRQLRNHTSEVLRRVEAGETIQVTVDRRPVAQLAPLERRPTWVPALALWEGIRDTQADPGLRRELREALPDTTDDL